MLPRQLYVAQWARHSLESRFCSDPTYTISKAEEICTRWMHIFGIFRWLLVQHSRTSLPTAVCYKTFTYDWGRCEFIHQFSWHFSSHYNKYQQVAVIYIDILHGRVYICTWFIYKGLSVLQYYNINQGLASVGDIYSRFCHLFLYKYLQNTDFTLAVKGYLHYQNNITSQGMWKLYKHGSPSQQIGAMRWKPLVDRRFVIIAQYYYEIWWGGEFKEEKWVRQRK